MKPFDVVFLALVFENFLGKSKDYYFLAFVPIFAFATDFGIDNHYHELIKAITIGCVFYRFLPVALLLALPIYQNLYEVLFVTLLWIVLSFLLRSLNPLFEENYIPAQWKGEPQRLVTLGLLYQTLYPFSFL